MPAHFSYDYAVIRIVPYVERQEFINAGVILYCRSKHYLDAMIDFQLKRLKLLAPQADLEMIRAHLNVIHEVCKEKDPENSFIHMNKSERFHWLISPSSTIIQVSPVHNGICLDPAHALQDLYRMFVPEN